MAGEWIRVRAALRKDPRVRAMADFLAEQRAFMDWMTDPVRRTCGVTVYEHVTRDVTVRITVCALVDLWSAANEAGKGDGDDLVMVHCTIDALDTMADLPCFGEAMASVDWAIQEEDERGRPVVRLPKFLIHNTPADERKPSAAAERQRRYRQRQAEQAQERDVTRDASSNVTRDVTVTPREEKSREEKKEEKTPRKRGARTAPDDFTVTEEMRDWAALHAPRADLQRESEKFRDWEFKDAKTDWVKAWRNWMRKASDDASSKTAGANETPYQRSQREKYEQVAPAIAAKSPGVVGPTNVMEILDARVVAQIGR